MGLSHLSFIPAMQRSLRRINTKCALDSCRNNQLMRSLPGGRQGIQLGQLWYCSVDCFVEAACTPLAQLSSRRVVEISRSPRLSLGLALLSKGYLTPEQLRLATEQGQRLGENLDATLIHLATDKQLATARSAQWGYPVLAREHMGHMVQADIPQTILHVCSAVPFHYSSSARRILLGFVFRVEHGLLESIEHITGCRVEPCFVTLADLGDQVERLTRPPGYTEILVDDPGTPEKMARTLGRMAVEVAAQEARFTHCKHQVWTRLTGKRETVDVVFRMANDATDAVCAETDFRAQALASLG